jgi:hypothetical protein
LAFCVVEEESRKYNKREKKIKLRAGTALFQCCSILCAFPGIPDAIWMIYKRGELGIDIESWELISWRELQSKGKCFWG